MAQPLPEQHAEHRRDQRQQRRTQLATAKRAAPQQSSSQGQGRNGERQTQRLHQFVLAQPQRLQVRHRRNHEHASGGSDDAGDQAAERTEPALDATAHAQGRQKQTAQRIEQQRRAQSPHDPVSTGHANPQRARTGADENRQQHRPQPFDQPEQMPAERQLPDVGQRGRDDQQRRSLRRRHSQTEQAHGDGRQAETDHTLDHAGQQEGCDDQQRKGQAEVLIKSRDSIHGAMVSLDGSVENLPYTEGAST
ncbi:hypothetical protein D3C85_1174400 [compost metagenome]